MNRGEIRTEVRTRTAEPVENRFLISSEINNWINLELLDLSLRLEFLKKRSVFAGSTHVATLGVNPRYYQLPSDFIKVDKNRGFLMNGLKRLPTTDREFYSMQEKGIETDTDGTVEANEFFAESYTGLIFHYTLDFVWPSEILAAPARTGKLAWFDPNPIDTDSIQLTYIAEHPLLTADGETPYLDTRFHDLIVIGVCRRAAQKFISAGIVQGSEMFLTFNSEYSQRTGEAIDYYDNIRKIPDKRFKIKTARQAFGMYNSQRRSRVLGSETE